MILTYIANASSVKCSLEYFIREVCSAPHPAEQKNIGNENAVKELFNKQLKLQTGEK